MQIIHWGKARKFYKNHPVAENPLKQWRQTVQEPIGKIFPMYAKHFHQQIGSKEK